MARTQPTIWVAVLLYGGWECAYGKNIAKAMLLVWLYNWEQVLRSGEGAA